MKKLFFILAVMSVGKAGFAQQATTPATSKSEMAVLEWDSQSFDFGKIKQSVPVTHEFKFTNKGKVALVITNVAASCGCTTPSWSRDPVAPGQQGFVKATYNAGGVSAFTKTVTVTANIEQGTAVLTIKGEVVAGAIQ